MIKSKNKPSMKKHSTDCTCCTNYDGVYNGPHCQHCPLGAPPVSSGEDCDCHCHHEMVYSEKGNLVSSVDCLKDSPESTQCEHCRPSSDNWSERFDKEFKCDCASGTCTDIEDEVNANDIKAFIKDLLAEQRKVWCLS